MTPDELRKLAEANGLIALAPDLARLCAELADVLKEVDDDPEDLSEDDIKGVLAKFSELEAK